MNHGYVIQVDIAYIPFVERFRLVLSEIFKHDITAGRPKLTAWIEVCWKQFCVHLSSLVFIPNRILISILSNGFKSYKSSSIKFLFPGGEQD